MSLDLGVVVWIPSLIFAGWMLLVSTRVEQIRGRRLTQKERSKQLTKMAILATLMLITGGLAGVFSSGLSLSSGNAILVGICCVLGPIAVVLLVLVPARFMLLGYPSAGKRKVDEATENEELKEE